MFEFFLETLSKIYDEYCTLTYTSKLSREQLRDISNKVPKPLEFNEKIKRFKCEIMDEYDISSSDFDKALKIIKQHPEFSWNMGKELLICKFSDNSLLLLKECSRGENDWMLEYKNIPDDEFYALLSYKELGRFPSLYNFSEEFSSIFNDFKSSLRLDVYALTPSVDLEYIIAGMEMCCQNKYATFLKSK